MQNKIETAETLGSTRTVLCVFVAELTHVVSPCLDDAAGETEGEQTTWGRVHLQRLLLHDGRSRQQPEVRAAFSTKWQWSIQICQFFFKLNWFFCDVLLQRGFLFQLCFWFWFLNGSPFRKMCFHDYSSDLGITTQSVQVICSRPVGFDSQEIKLYSALWSVALIVSFCSSYLLLSLRLF